MNTVAWVLQIVLAVLFLLHGLLFTVAYGAAAKRMEARGRPPSSLPPALRQFIGVAELAAAFGLAVPPALHLFSWLAPLAAAPLGTNHWGHGIAQRAKFSRGSRCLLRLIPSPSVSRSPPRRSDFAGRRGIARLSQPSREPARP